MLTHYGSPWVRNTCLSKLYYTWSGLLHIVCNLDAIDYEL